MSKIKIMSENLANKIAAGEVVEKVVSIVKELVENAIDAKSDMITIELKESGLREIKITDNGIGMDKEDAHLAFARHATSKLYDEDDLFNINSLGFRGEALPSIASVSELELNTCQKEADIGTYIHIKGGKIIEETTIGKHIGTSFKIYNLFYNTPARLKHLSSPYSELSNVIDYVNKIALAYPNIRVRLLNDDKEILSTNGSGNLLKVINSIYGLDITKKMISINNSNDDYMISGYISYPSVNRSNKNYITTLVNGRVVKNTNLYRIINEAYSNYKEDTRYPICVINLECDPSLLDVNIHPNKLDIKFSNFDELTSLISTTIKRELENKLLIPSINISKKTEDSNYKQLSLNLERITVNEDNISYKSKLEDLINNPSNYDNLINDTESLEDSKEEDSIIIDDSILEDNPNKLPELYPVGLLLGTYIVCENELGIYLIDFHAAKERINYEKVSYELANPSKSSISMLIPIVIELPKDEYIILKENLNILEELNINVEEFGTNSFRVLSHPTWFTTGKEKKIMDEIIEQIIKKEKNFSLAKFRDNLAKMVSCKMSIKANNYIDKASMESLIDDLRKCHNPYNCPHGRPSIIHFTKYELEKMFKRSI